MTTATVACCVVEDIFNRDNTFTVGFIIVVVEIVAVAPLIPKVVIRIDIVHLVPFASFVFRPTRLRRCDNIGERLTLFQPETHVNEVGALESEKADRIKVANVVVALGRGNIGVVYSIFEFVRQLFVRGFPVIEEVIERFPKW